MTDKTFYENGHSLYEVNFNLTDVTLKGTENHISQMEEVINKFQVRLNQDRIDADAYAFCMDDK